MSKNLIINDRSGKCIGRVMYLRQVKASEPATGYAIPLGLDGTLLGYIENKEVKDGSGKLIGFILESVGEGPVKEKPSQGRRKQASSVYIKDSRYGLSVWEGWCEGFHNTCSFIGKMIKGGGECIEILFASAFLLGIVLFFVYLFAGPFFCFGCFGDETCSTCDGSGFASQTSAEICEDCKGSGYCSSCSVEKIKAFNGYHYESVSDSICESYGITSSAQKALQRNGNKTTHSYYDCVWCEGTGICTKCHGTAYWFSYCPTCYGSNKCQACRGRGNTPLGVCSTCMGAKTCNECDNNGIIVKSECEECKGKGVCEYCNGKGRH